MRREDDEVYLLRLLASATGATLTPTEVPTLSHVFLAVKGSANGPAWMLLTETHGRYFLSEITNDQPLKAGVDHLVPALVGIDHNDPDAWRPALVVILKHMVTS